MDERSDQTINLSWFGTDGTVICKCAVEILERFVDEDIEVCRVHILQILSSRIQPSPSDQSNGGQLSLRIHQQMISELDAIVGQDLIVNHEILNTGIMLYMDNPQQ